MLDRQRAVADAAVFADDHGVGVDAVRLTDSLDRTERAGATAGDAPVVVGVDVGFRGETAVAAAVALTATAGVVAVGAATTPVQTPYVPGLLSYREGEAVLAALEDLDADPDLLVVDGSGRMHFRSAGLATHLGVVLDVPAVGVAKNLLCGRVRRSVEGGLPEGERVAVAADDAFEYGTEPGTVVGYAVSTRQYDNPDRHVNPVYVSPGHRVSAATAAGFVLALAPAYKLPEPTRLADRHADVVET